MNRTCRKFLVKGFAVSLFSMVAVFAGASNAHAGCTRDQGQQYCTSDAMKLCSAFIPNETKIQACLRKNVKKLSPDCKKCFSSFAPALNLN
ncbi:MAG: hypothetical protein ACXWQJ_15565 [Bdellovibrionota bacterium]